MANSKQDKIQAQKYIIQNFGYDIYEVSDPSLCADNFEDVELGEAEKTKQIIEQSKYEEDKFHYMAQMSTPVKNERHKTAFSLTIRSGTGLQ